jgi:hypothetical protein
MLQELVQYHNQTHLVIIGLEAETVLVLIFSAHIMYYIMSRKGVVFNSTGGFFAALQNRVNTLEYGKPTIADIVLLTDVADPSNPQDVATKNYVDNAVVKPIIHLPDMQMNGYTQENVINYLHSIYQPYTHVHVNGYIHGASTVNSAYIGGVYSPTQNRIYLLPAAASSQSIWHYIDCDDGSVIPYTHGAAISGTYMYSGGVYSPTQNRIYLVPLGQSNNTTWHYIDCNDELVKPYNVTNIETLAYSGGVYSPTQNRIYLVPYGHSDNFNWHYIDCDDGIVKSYDHFNFYTPNPLGYIGGVYSPTQNRIYFIPFEQSNQTEWHYIDCDDGIVIRYDHETTLENQGYIGGVYSPTQNRIYLVPSSQSDKLLWHYIDCDDGIVKSYAHGMTLINQYGYNGGVYSPIHNRIYLVPQDQSTQTNWHYINCDDGSVKSYDRGSAGFVSSGYKGGVYSPTQNRIYLVPFNQSNSTNWHYINLLTTAPVDISLMSGPLFNKY